MPRYDNAQDYGRAHESVRRDGRDVRRAVDTVDRRTTMERDYHQDDAMDMRMDARAEPTRTANTGTRIMERPARGNDPREVAYRDPRMGNFYQDTRTGELYRDPPSRKTPYDNEFDDMQPSSRPIVVTAADPAQPRASYAEYFLPGEGIEREVIQSEICRYLGQDATCKPGKNPADGRPGYLIKAYRALTTEMIRSLQESSSKLRSEWMDKDKKRRRQEVSYTPIQDHAYDRDMDMDDDDRDRGYMQQDRYTRDIDPRDPRNQMSNRHGLPVTTGYMQEPGYPAYSIASAQSGVSPMAFEPRTFAAGGNTTPPTGFRTTAFPSSDFPPRSAQAPAPAMPAQTYMDPRTGKMVSSYSPYPQEPARNRR